MNYFRNAAEAEAHQKEVRRRWEHDRFYKWLDKQKYPLSAAGVKKFSEFRLKEMREVGIRYVGLLGCPDVNGNCAAAKAIMSLRDKPGVPIKIENAQSLPLPGCDQKHCKCLWGALENPEKSFMNPPKSTPTLSTPPIILSSAKRGNNFARKIWDGLQQAFYALLFLVPVAFMIYGLFHFFILPDISGETSPPPSPVATVIEPEVKLTPEQHAGMVQLETTGLIRIEAGRGIVWINPTVWLAMPGSTKEDFIAALSSELAARENTRTANVELRDMQSAQTLATWKYGLLGQPEFKAY